MIRDIRNDSEDPGKALNKLAEMGAIHLMQEHLDSMREAFIRFRLIIEEGMNPQKPAPRQQIEQLVDAAAEAIREEKRKK